MDKTNRRPCVFLIPVLMGDAARTPVSPEYLDTVLETLIRHFGGYTVLGVVDGGWAESPGHPPVQEQSLRIEVLVLDKEIPRLRAVVKRIGKDLRQKEMYFLVGPPGGEFLDCEGEELEEDDEPD